MIKCLLTESGRAERENIWTSGQIFSRSARPDSVNKHIVTLSQKLHSTSQEWLTIPKHDQELQCYYKWLPLHILSLCGINRSVMLKQ